MDFGGGRAVVEKNREDDDRGGRQRTDRIRVRGCGGLSGGCGGIKYVLSVSVWSHDNKQQQRERERAGKEREQTQTEQKI
jgi:hypothetical protein